jgi:hypothetical protein
MKNCGFDELVSASYLPAALATKLITHTRDEILSDKQTYIVMIHILGLIISPI